VKALLEVEELERRECPSGALRPEFVIKGHEPITEPPPGSHYPFIRITHEQPATNG
jgi:hypothetical protein